MKKNASQLRRRPRLVFASKGTQEVQLDLNEARSAPARAVKGEETEDESAIFSAGRVVAPISWQTRAAFFQASCVCQAIAHADKIAANGLANPTGGAQAKKKDSN